MEALNTEDKSSLNLIFDELKRLRVSRGKAFSPTSLSCLLSSLPVYFSEWEHEKNQDKAEHHWLSKDRGEVAFPLHSLIKYP